MAMAVMETAVTLDVADLEARALDAFCAGFASRPLTAADAADAVARLAVVERQIVGGQEPRGARRVDVSSVWKHAGFRTMAEWMAAKTGDPVPASSGLLDTASKLEALSGDGGGVRRRGGVAGRGP